MQLHNNWPSNVYFIEKLSSQMSLCAQVQKKNQKNKIIYHTKFTLKSQYKNVFLLINEALYIHPATTFQATNYISLAEKLKFVIAIEITAKIKDHRKYARVCLYSRRFPYSYSKWQFLTLGGCAWGCSASKNWVTFLAIAKIFHYFQFLVLPTMQKKRHSKVSNRQYVCFFDISIFLQMQ